MKKPFALLFGGLLFSVLLLMGCNKSEVTGPEDPNDQIYGSAQNDQQFFELYARNDEYANNDDVAMNDGSSPTPFDDEIVGRMTPIRPLRWARLIRNIQRTVQIDSVTADSLAYVTVTKSWDGVLIILARYDSVTVDTVRKNFTGQSKKRFIYKKIANSRVIWRNWKPVAVSLVDGGTTSSNAIDITELKLVYSNESGNRDSIVVTDPLSTFLRLRRNRDIGGHDVPDLAGGQEARMFATVISTSPDTDHVVLRFGFSGDGNHRRRLRLHLVSESFDGTHYTRVYARTFNLHFNRGVFAAAVDAMTHGTLFDDAEPVSNVFWGVPYLVTR